MRHRREDGPLGRLFLAQGAQGQITKMQALLTRMPKGSFNWILGPFDEASDAAPGNSTTAQQDRNQGPRFRWRGRGLCDPSPQLIGAGCSRQRS